MITRAQAAFAALLGLQLSTTAIAAENPVQGITMTQQSADLWRAYKLVGVTIYGPDNKTVGKISDILMSHDGKAQDVIVGVGGFLGIGEKDVAIPFTSVSFSDKPMPIATPAPSNNLAATPATGAGSTGAAGANGTMAATPALGAPVNALGTANTAPMGGMAGDAPVAPSTAFPYYGTIAFTADQLKSAPAFKFAP